jgi:zinc protease
MRSVLFQLGTLLFFLLFGMGAASNATASPNGLVPKDFTLSNGMKLRVIEDHELPVVVMALLVPGGFTQDPVDRVGVAGLTGRLLTQGTRHRTAVELATAIEGLGTSIDVSTQAGFTVLDTDVLARDLGAGLALLAEVVEEPSFTQENFEEERDIAMARVRDELEQPESVAERALYETLYGDHPYGRPDDGTLDGLQKIARSDVASWHDEWFRPTGAVLAIVGDTTPGQARKLVEKAFAGWKGAPPSSRLPDPPKAWPGTRQVMVDMPGQTQAQIRIASRSIPRHSPDWRPLQVANALLGDGFTSLLVEEIRVNRSLSYGAGSDLSSFLDESVFSIRTFTKNVTARQTIEVALQVLDSWSTSPWKPEAFDRAHRYFEGMVPQMYETPISRAWQLLLMAWHGQSATWMADQSSAIRKTDQSEAQTAATRDIRPDGRLVLVVGDASQLKDQLSTLGTGHWETVVAR